MSLRYLANCSMAALAGATMLALSMSSASAFTLSGPSLGAPIASVQIEKVWWDRYGVWHPNGHRVADPNPGYGYGNGYGGERRCWAGYNGVVHCAQ